MKALKRICIVAFSVLLLLAGVAFLGKDMGDKALKQAVIYNGAVSKITDIVKGAYPNMTSDQLEQMQTLINDNEELNTVTEKYIEAFEEYVADGDRTGDISDYLDKESVTAGIDSLSGQIVNMAVEGMGTQLSELQKALIGSVTAYVSENIERQITEQCNSAVNLISGKVIFLMKCYVIITSMAARVIIVACIIMTLAAILLLNVDKLRFSYNVGAPMLISGIISVAISLISRNAAATVSSDLVGSTISVDIKPWLIYGLTLFAMGAALTIAWIVKNSRRSQ